MVYFLGLYVVLGMVALHGTTGEGSVKVERMRAKGKP
jgi:hypothetical protein